MLGMPFEPVDAAGQHRAPHRHPQGGFSPHQLPLLGAGLLEVAGHAHRHPMGFLALPFGDPPRGQPQLRPPAVDLGGQRVGVSVSQVADDGVDQRADGRRAHPRPLSTRRLQSPPQTTRLELLDLGRRDRNVVFGQAPWPPIGRRNRCPPTLRMGAANPRDGQPGQPAGRPLAHGGVVIRSGPPQLPHEGGQVKRPRHDGEGAGRQVVRQGVDDIEVDTRLLVVVAHCRQHDAFARSGQRHMKEAGLVVPHGRSSGLHSGIAAGDDVDQSSGAEQRPTQAQVGPHPLLQSGDDDQPPLAPGRSRRGEDGDGLRAGRPRSERVLGELLPEDVLEETLRPGSREPLVIAHCGVEQPDDGIEIAIRASGPRTAAQDVLLPRAGHPQAGPDRPQHRLGADSGRPAAAGGAPDIRSGRSDSGRERRADPPQRLPVGPDHGCGHAVADGGGQQLVAGAVSAHVEFVAAQRSPKPTQAHGVRPAQR